MKAWLPPQIPQLPDTGPIPQLYDTATRSLRSSLNGSSSLGSAGSAGPDGIARLYVCGITPYDATHIGHAATYVTFDLLVRAWKDAGLAVRYVQNVTDIDDPLLERANDTGENWEALAERQVELFRTDMAALRAVPPDHYVGVVESMPLVLDLVETLRERGTVYELADDLYFRIDGDDAFGTVSGLDRPTMLELSAERGGDPDRPGKKDPLDSLLWQHERPGEPAWDSPYGRGRPGWHTECAAIARHHLGAEFDVQGGGSDLAFPHHELSTAQLRATSDEPLPAPAYVHQAMVGLDGEKMSKSRGNLVFVSALRADGVDPMAIRLALLVRPYRDDWEWTPDGLGAAEGRLARWRSAIAVPAGPSAPPVLAAVRAALASDLDAPAAVAAIDEWASRALAGEGTDPGAGDLIRRTADALLGVAL